jgi:hypothetical protein
MVLRVFGLIKLTSFVLTSKPTLTLRIFLWNSPPVLARRFQLCLSASGGDHHWGHEWRLPARQFNWHDRSTRKQSVKVSIVSHFLALTTDGSRVTLLSMKERVPSLSRHTARCLTSIQLCPNRRHSFSTTLTLESSSSLQLGASLFRGLGIVHFTVLC